MGRRQEEWLYEITLREEFAKINELTGVITLSSRNTNRSWGKESCGQLGRDGGLRLWFDGMLSEGSTILHGVHKSVYMNQININGAKPRLRCRGTGA
jgi:hypothetical protein